MDFEKASLNAFEGLHPNCSLTGYFFHLSKNIWKKVQSAGIQQRYQDDDDFSLHVRMIMSLAFVPLADLDTAFDDLFTEIRTNYNNDMDQVLNYFEDTYWKNASKWATRRSDVRSRDVEYVHPHKRSFAADKQ